MSLKERIQAIDRRAVLRGMVNVIWAAPVALGLGQFLKFLRFEPPTEQATRFTLGSPGSFTTFPVYLESGQVWLFQDSGGYYAVDAICTHLGCTVYAQPDSSFQCRCHGSQFAADGRVLVGPATVPLRFLQLSWDGGRLVVDRAQQVDPSVRLPAL
jgi:cytochrome b6-f complex iron-sulfur subunit